MRVRTKETEKGRDRKRDACISDWDSWLLSCVVPESRERENERKRKCVRESVCVCVGGGE